MTWLKLKTTVESFLESLWRQAGLPVTAPKMPILSQSVLGQPLFPQEIAEGERLIIEGGSADQCAEFIIIEFTHKLQQS